MHYLPMSGAQHLAQVEARRVADGVEWNPPLTREAPKGAGVAVQLHGQLLGGEQRRRRCRENCRGVDEARIGTDISIIAG
jgi:hypothetical protein